MKKQRIEQAQKPIDALKIRMQDVTQQVNAVMTTLQALHTPITTEQRVDILERVISQMIGAMNIAIEVMGQHEVLLDAIGSQLDEKHDAEMAATADHPIDVYDQLARPADRIIKEHDRRKDG